MPVKKSRIPKEKPPPSESPMAFTMIEVPEGNRNQKAPGIFLIGEEIL